MSVVLQAYLGALPVFIALIVYLIKRKKYVLPGIVFAVQVIVCSSMIASDMSKPEEEMDVIELYESYKEMEKGNYLNAMDLINEIYSASAEQMEITLAKARLYAVQGCWEEAAALYEKVINHKEEIVNSAEKKLLDRFKKGEMLTAKQLSYQSSNIHYLKEQGVNPSDYGFKELSDAQIKENANYLNDIQFNVVPEIVEDQIKQMEKDYTILADIEEIDEAVETIMSYEYNSFEGQPIEEESLDNNASEDEIKEQEEKLKSRYDIVRDRDGEINWEKTHKKTKETLNKKLVNYKKKYPSLFEKNKYLEAYIFSELHVGHKLDDVLLNGSHKAYEIISNMYISGIISEKNFSKKFTEEYKEMYKEVLAQCKEVAKDLGKKEDLSEIYIGSKSVEEIVEGLDEQEDFALQQIAQDMSDLVEKKEVDDGDLSEILLNMSMVENEIGHREQAKELLNEAIENSDKSADKEISQTLGVIKNAYETGGDDLDYIEVSNKVADLYENQFHYDIVSDELKEDVKGVAGSTVSETLARVNIGRIKVVDFPEIRVSIQHSGDTKLSKDIITLKDCGIEIEDYELSKKDYEGSKVVLLCDVSGSMSSSGAQLIEAVSRYVKSMVEGEQVNIVVFSDSIKASSGFSKATNFYKLYHSPKTFS